MPMGASASDASLECAEVLGAEVFAGETGRPPHPASASSHSSRSTSPASNSGSNSGKMYMCNMCSREYASTDAVRKHARQQHPEWLKMRGIGCTSLYCTPVEPAAVAPIHGVVAANFNHELHKDKEVAAVAKPAAALFGEGWLVGENVFSPVLSALDKKIGVCRRAVSDEHQF